MCYLMSININNIAILNIYEVDICCIIARIRMSEAINISKNADLRENSESLQQIYFYYI